MGARAHLIVDVTAQCMKVGEASLVADACGVLYWPAQRTLLVADLHLEKGAHYAGRGAFLPPYDTRETLRRLADAVARYEPVRVIALGDSFHSERGADEISQVDVDTLASMQRQREWIWITGNHDPRIAARVGGSVAPELQIDGVALRHAPREGRESHEIAGHLHPVARIAGRGMTLRRRCFIGDGGRVVMPAFGAFAGGLNVLDSAFAPLFPMLAATAVLLLGETGLYPVPVPSLRPD